MTAVVADIPKELWTKSKPSALPTDIATSRALSEDALPSGSIPQGFATGQDIAPQNSHCFLLMDPTQVLQERGTGWDLPTQSASEAAMAYLANKDTVWTIVHTSYIRLQDSKLGHKA